MWRTSGHNIPPETTESDVHRRGLISSRRLPDGVREGKVTAAKHMILEGAYDAECFIEVAIARLFSALA